MTYEISTQNNLFRQKTGNLDTLPISLNSKICHTKQQNKTLKVRICLEKRKNNSKLIKDLNSYISFFKSMCTVIREQAKNASSILAAGDLYEYIKLKPGKAYI